MQLDQLINQTRSYERQRVPVDKRVTIGGWTATLSCAAAIVIHHRVGRGFTTNNPIYGPSRWLLTAAGNTDTVIACLGAVLALSLLMALLTQGFRFASFKQQIALAGVTVAGWLGSLPALLGLVATVTATILFIAGVVLIVLLLIQLLAAVAG